MATLQSRGSNSEYEIWLLDDVDDSGTNASEAIEVGPFMQADVQVNHAGHGDTSTYSVQTSQDGTNYVTISGTAKTTGAGATGTDSQTLSPLPGGWIRLIVTEADGGATPTLTPYITLKDRRRK